MENINIGTVENDGTGEKLRDAFKIVNKNFQELSKSYKELVACATYSEATIATNTPLIVGNKYYINLLRPGDNFSNVGFVEEGRIFIATETYPISWTATSVKAVTVNITTYVNTFSNVLFETLILGGYKYLKVTTEESFNNSNTKYDINLGSLDGSYYTPFDSIFELKRYI